MEREALILEVRKVIVLAPVASSVDSEYVCSAGAAASVFVLSQQCYAISRGNQRPCPRPRGTVD